MGPVGIAHMKQATNTLVSSTAPVKLLGAVPHFTYGALLFTPTNPDSLMPSSLHDGCMTPSVLMQLFPLLSLQTLFEPVCHLIFLVLTRGL